MHLSYRGIAHRTTIPAVEMTEANPLEVPVGDRFKLQQTTVAQRTGVTPNPKYRGVDHNA